MGVVSLLLILIVVLLKRKLLVLFQENLFMSRYKLVLKRLIVYFRLVVAKENLF